MILKLFKWFFNKKGWKTEGTGIPEHEQKAIIIAMPHTSNWDFVYGMAVLQKFNIKLNYLAKKELFFWPLKILLHHTGGIPVERSKNNKMVSSFVKKFNELNNLIIGIPVEGTRKRINKIKTGFYRVALQTGVPVYMAYLDYEKKLGGFSKAFYPSGDIKADAAIIKDFYRDKKGKFPDLFNLEAIDLA